MKRFFTSFLIPLILLAVIFAGFGQVLSAPNDPYCPPPRAVTIRTHREGDDLVFSWMDDSANDSYRVWLHDTDPFFDEGEGTVQATLPEGSNQYTHAGLFGTPEVRAYFRVEAQSSCAGSSAYSAHIGAATYPLTTETNKNSLITIPFAHEDLVDAADLAAHIGSVNSLLKWNEETQGFRVFLPPSVGDNFLISPGDTIFVNSADGGPSLADFHGSVVPTDAPMKENGYSFSGLPFQRGDLEKASAVSADITNVATLLKWNEVTQGFRVFIPPSGGDNFALSPGDPFLTRLDPGGPSRWPGVDGGMMQWAQAGGGSLAREVLLQWQDGEESSWPGQGYIVFRRKIGATIWEEVKTVEFAQSPSEMKDILGLELLTILSYDLRTDPDGAPLTDEEIYDRFKSERGLAIGFANQYHEVAQAVGLAYLDTAVPDIDLEYNILRKEDENWVTRPICAPVSPEIFTDFNLRESMVVNVPDGLGVNPSPRPDDAVERHDWGRYQDVRNMHGRAFLLWDEHATMEPPANPNACINAPQLMVAGYNIYRNGPAAGPDPVKANLQTVGAAQVGSQRRLLAATAGVPEAGAPDAEPYYFVDEVAKIYAGSPPEDIFTDWKYTVCSVDAMGNELACSDTVVVPIRELDSPASAIEPKIEVAADHSSLTYSWSYTDTSEISLPLRFFVSRSQELTLSSTQWTELTPGGIVAPMASPTFTLSINDTPPPNKPYWYRVQVRDNAGNWSAPSAAISAGLYNRTPPSTPNIPNGGQCESNSLPFLVSNMDKAVVQVTVYRAFDKAGPYQLIKRLEAEPGAGNTRFVWVDDLYVPPDTVTLHYKVEAIDAHGNVSEAAYFCAEHGDEPTPDPPAVWTDSEGTFSYTGDPVSDIITITVNTPAGTTTTTTTTLSGQLPTGAAPGQMVRVTVWTANESGSSDKTVFWIFPTNNFLDTGRHMYELGAPYDMYWNLNGPDPAVKIELALDKEAMPMVAVFRRVPGGNWMQATPVQFPYEVSGAWTISDTTDLNPGQAYSYTVMAFSPTNHELLGYWDEQLLPAATGESKVILNNDFVGVTPPVCNYAERQPTGIPNPIVLENGWAIHIAQVYVSDGSPDCPSDPPNPNNLFGNGDLYNSLGDSFPVTFYGISLDGVGNLIGGRIVADVAHEVDISERFAYTIEAIGFEPGIAEALVSVNLPPSLSMLDPATNEVGRRLVGRVENLTLDYQFDYLPYDGGGAGVTIINENLPWRLHVSNIVINHQFLGPNDIVTTTDRFSYPIQNGDNFTPDNNLGFMRRSFESTDAYISHAGLQGTFATFEPLTYHTSLPAGFVLDVGPTTVVISDSQIIDGVMETYHISLQYDWLGTSQDTFELVGNRFFVPCYWLLQHPSGNMPSKGGGCTSQPAYPSTNRYRTMEAIPFSGLMEIGAGGIIGGNVVNFSADAALKWPQFDVPFDLVETQTGHLYLAASSFPHEDPVVRLEPNSPLPAEVAWRQIPEPFITGGELDPGLNLNAINEPFNYHFYDPSIFAGDMDLYLRRGGMSEQIKVTMPDSSPRTNEFGYQETVTKFEVLFLDNWIDPDNTLLEMDLYLPYPSDVTIPLEVSEWDGNAPMGGEVTSDLSLHHRYWAFRQNVPEGTDWNYVPLEDTVYPEQYEINTGQEPDSGDLPPRIFDLSGGEAVSINGLYEKTGANSAGQATFPIDSQWLPTGDYGEIKFTAAQDDYLYVSGVPYVISGLRLNHYYVGFLKTTSLPDTMGLELDMTGIELPAALLNSQGELTQQSLKDCSIGGTAGCGFVLLDGNGAADYFGEVEPFDGSGQAAFVPNLPDFLGDDPVGQFPIAVNSISRQTVQAVVDPSALRWYWEVASDTLNELCPFVFLPNDSVSLNPVPVNIPIGGIFACLKRDLPVLPAPAPEVVVADLGLVVDFHLFKKMEVGVFLGYSASQATYRALAMNRPLPSGDSGVVPYMDWADVSNDIELWSEHFGYSFDGNRINKNDPVDLAYDLWSDWDTTVPSVTHPCRSNPTGDLTFNETDEVLEPLLRSLDGNDAYGVTGVEAGAVLDFPPPGPPFDSVDAEAWMDTGMGQAVFCGAGLDFRLENIFFGTELGVDVNGNNPLLDTDWVSMDMNRDGEYVITGENIQIGFMKDLGTGADLHLRILQSDPANERIEGSVHLRAFETLVLDLNGLDVYFGSGLYENQPIFYVGGQGEITGLFGISSGIQAFYGTLNTELTPLRDSGLDFLLDAFTAQDLDTGSSGFLGFYGVLYTEFDLDTFGCLMSINARAELRAWYWESPDFPDYKVGGTLYGSMYGEVACLLSARGDISLTFELVPTGAHTTPPPTWPSMTKQCQLALPNYNGCYAGAGISWVAIGIGFDCDPHTWKSWSSRWWGDSWCWTFGAGIGLSFIGPTQSVGDVWDFDFEIDFEF